jgi:hypothetical protein
MPVTSCAMNPILYFENLLLIILVGLAVVLHWYCAIPCTTCKSY